MKNSKELAHRICRVSDLLDKSDQHFALNFAVALGLINSSMVQIDLTSREIKMNGVTFAEAGIGKLVANSLY